MKDNRQKNQGFTLIELMITIAIASIVMALGATGFKSSIVNNRLATTTNEMVAAMNLARNEAIKRGQPVVIRRTGSQWEAGWKVFVDISRVSTNANTFDDNGSNPTCEADEDCLLKVYPALANNYMLRGTSSFIDYVRYSPSGNSHNAGTFILCENSDGNNTAEAGTSKLIIVNIVGRVRTGIDNNDDGIPERIANTNITSCTNPT